MTATTNTEIYRRFKGELKPARPGFAPLWLARVRVGLKRKVTMLLLFGPPWIVCIWFAGLVYTKFAIEAGSEVPGIDPAAAIASAMAGQLIQVHDQVVFFNFFSRFFALLAIAWYGAGLICEDRRAGAHLLYFSRPLSRLDYFLSQFATVYTFGAFVSVLPTAMICAVAVFSSPDYSFLTQKWEVVAGALGYALAYVMIIGLIALAASSLSTRKAYALAGVFGVALGSFAVGGALAGMQRDKDFFMLSIPGNLERLAGWMLDTRRTPFDWNPWWSVAILGGICVLCLLVIAWRLRRLEVVA